MLGGINNRTNCDSVNPQITTNSKSVVGLDRKQRPRKDARQIIFSCKHKKNETSEAQRTIIFIMLITFPSYEFLVGLFEF